MIDRGMLDYVMDRVRPQIQGDGGDVEVTDINDEEGIVYVALKGACVDCALSSLTLSQGIERVLVEHVPGVVRVLPDPKQAGPMMGGMFGGMFGGTAADEDEGFAASDRFGEPVRVTRVNEDGTISEETL